MNCHQLLQVNHELPSLTPVHTTKRGIIENWHNFGRIIRFPYFVKISHWPKFNMRESKCWWSVAGWFSLVPCCCCCLQAVPKSPLRWLWKQPAPRSPPVCWSPSCSTAPSSYRTQKVRPSFLLPLLQFSEIRIRIFIVAVNFLISLQGNLLFSAQEEAD